MASAGCRARLAASNGEGGASAVVKRRRSAEWGARPRLARGDWKGEKLGDGDEVTGPVLTVEA